MDVGSPESLAADRAEELSESRMYKIIERKKFSMIIPIRIPTPGKTDFKY